MGTAVRPPLGPAARWGGWKWVWAWEPGGLVTWRRAGGRGPELEGGEPPAASPPLTLPCRVGPLH